MSSQRPQPVAWTFELATHRNADTGEYTFMGEPKLSFRKPHVPEGAIRNLKPLYAGSDLEIATIATEPDGFGGVLTHVEFNTGQRLNGVSHLCCNYNERKAQLSSMELTVLVQDIHQRKEPEG